MGSAYLRIELGDSEDVKAPRFVVSPVPFVWHYGDIFIPTESEQRKATSYAELCTILTKDFHIPKTLLPPKKYFKPTGAERDGDCWNIYRRVPEGTGEPELRTKARRAIIALLEEDETLLERGQVSINDRL